MSSKEELTLKYNEMLSKVETAKMYDGRNTYDLYVCNGCKNRLVTTYMDKGVTPFIMRCPYCGGDMQHTKTAHSIDPGIPYRRWVRPNLDQFLHLSPALQDHVLCMGLLLEEELPHDDSGYLGSDGSMIGKLFDGNDVLRAHRDSCPFTKKCKFRGLYDCTNECDYQKEFKELLKGKNHL